MNCTAYSRILFISILAASLSTVAAYGQTEEAKANNTLKDGAWALQFQIAGNFTLTSFQGVAISAKRHLSASNALRLGVNVGLNNNEFNRLDKTYERDTLSLRTGSSTAQSSNGQSFEINGQYLFYANPEEEVNFFLGGGPLVRFSRGYQESSSIPTLPSGTTYQTGRATTEETSWGAGLSGLAGVEWFATKRLSFHAEYGLTIVYESRTATNTVVTIVTPPISYEGRRITEDTGKGWRLSSSGVRFGLSVYF